MKSRRQLRKQLGSRTSRRHSTKIREERRARPSVLLEKLVKKEQEETDGKGSRKS